MISISPLEHVFTDLSPGRPCVLTLLIPPCKNWARQGLLIGTLKMVVGTFLGWGIVFHIKSKLPSLGEKRVRTIPDSLLWWILLPRADTGRLAFAEANGHGIEQWWVHQPSCQGCFWDLMSACPLSWCNGQGMRDIAGLPDLPLSLGESLCPTGR